MARKKLIWHTERVRVGDLFDWEKNPRFLTDRQAADLDKSLERFGYVETVVLNADRSVIGGHMRKLRMLERGMITVDDEIDCRLPNRKLTVTEAEELAIRLNKNSGSWDMDSLANNFDIPDLLDWGFEKWELGIQNDLLPNDDTDIDDEEGEDPTATQDKGELVKVEFLMPRDGRDRFFKVLGELKERHDLSKTEDAVIALTDFYQRNR